MRDQITTIIFEVEGTLIDCVPHVLESWQRTLESADHNLPLATLQRYSGMDGSEMLDILLPGAREQVKEHLLKTQGETYRRDYLGRGRAFEGVHGLFQALRETGYGLGIATTCNQDELSAYDRKMQVLRLTDAVACGDDAQHGKPHPDLYRIALQKLRVRVPSSAMAVGDTPYDAIAAKTLGMRAVGLLTGGFSRDDLISASCEDVLVHPRDLGAHLGMFPQLR
jgi:phosphoglycolate phosphatase-like HAD superfamily hydrolase